MNCEFCGSTIRGEPQAVNLDGGLFRVCNNCARLGTPARLPRPVTASKLYSAGSGVPSKSGPRTYSRPPSGQPSFLDTAEELQLRHDFSKIIKEARESFGLSQEEVGRKINEKPSVISHLEVGSMKPSDILARKLEHFLKIKLFVPADEEEGEEAQSA